MSNKIYNPNNISSLSRHLGVSTACIHNYKKGKIPDKEMNTLKLMLLGAGYTESIDKKTKFNLIMRGWNNLCKENSSESK